MVRKGITSRSYAVPRDNASPSQKRQTLIACIGLGISLLLIGIINISATTGNTDIGKGLPDISGVQFPQIEGTSKYAFDVILKRDLSFEISAMTSAQLSESETPFAISNWVDTRVANRCDSSVAARSIRVIDPSLMNSQSKPLKVVSFPANLALVNGPFPKVEKDGRGGIFTSGGVSYALENVFAEGGAALPLLSVSPTTVSGVDVLFSAPRDILYDFSLALCIVEDSGEVRRLEPSNERGNEQMEVTWQFDGVLAPGAKVFLELLPK